MENNELTREMLMLKKRIHHLKMSTSLSASVFGFLKTIHNHAVKQTFKDEEKTVMRLNDLFEKIHVSRPAISKILKECEMKEYVFRIASESDKRYVYVGLTEYGEKVLHQAECEINSSIQWMISQFDENEKEQMKNLIIKINQVLDEFMKGGAQCCD